MSEPQKKDTIRIDLTQEQPKETEQATSKETQAPELNVQELEERVNPMVALD
jgi:hypothetical protein